MGGRGQSIGGQSRVIAAVHATEHPRAALACDDETHDTRVYEKFISRRGADTSVRFSLLAICKFFSMNLPIGSSIEVIRRFQAAVAADDWKAGEPAGRSAVVSGG